jgi:hypothetical protein
MAKYLLIWSVQMNGGDGSRETSSEEDTIDCDPEDLQEGIDGAKRELQETLRRAQARIAYTGTASVSLTQVVPL